MKQYFIEMQNDGEPIMNSRDFATLQDAEEWANGIDVPDEYELWIMSILYDEMGMVIMENYMKLLNAKEDDPCDRCNRPICYGCPHAEEN